MNDTWSNLYSTAETSGAGQQYFVPTDPASYQAREVYMPDAVAAAKTLIAERVRDHPSSPFNAFAAKEMARVDTRLTQGPSPDRAFYETLTHGIGLMCARELEASDMPLCDAIYSMMAEIRRMT